MRTRIVLAALGFLITHHCAAQAEALPLGFSDLCHADPDHKPLAWQISKALKPALWPTRLICEGDALRIAVHPGDTFDPNPGSNPTERVEIQTRRELVHFEQPIWYRFSFRLNGPWRGADSAAVGNRSVIHQIKQDIDPALKQPAGSCPSANPLFKIEAVPTQNGASFLVKVRGTTNCHDGGEAVVICGPWPLAENVWHEVRVMLKPSQHDGQSEVRVALNGQACPLYTGMLGYPNEGAHDAKGHPVIDAQPRFGLYRDALANTVQSIAFRDITFWTSPPPP